MKELYRRYLEKMKPSQIQWMIMSIFSLISVSTMLLMGIVLYFRFSNVTEEETIENTQTLMEQAGENMEDFLVSMRQISDTAYYNVIKESDFSTQKEEIERGLHLLYEANRDNLRSIAIYNKNGSLLVAEPVATQKEDPDVTSQDWYRQALQKFENIHFSIPHIQNLFDDNMFRYYWVISSSRVVELTNQGNSELGVLLVDMDFANISRMMKQINKGDQGTYFYLCDGKGKIIYHPRQVQIKKGICNENTAFSSKKKDGVYDEVFEGERRKILVNTISYTGWKLVGVIPQSSFTNDMIDIRYFIVLVVILLAMTLLIINQVVSEKITSPIRKLNASVMEHEAGKKPGIYIGGSTEIRHLGDSIQRSYEQSEALMKEIVWEQNERRKSELEALQSQINPHFLYNALDSITWMIEGERNEEASFMVSQLAKLFRISLSKGHTIISIKDELQHARSYMNIQKIRYKDKFSVEFDVNEKFYQYCTVKLTLQPILENAINYGVRNMDEGGEIRITGKMDEQVLILSVEDNGFGIAEEEVPLLLTDDKRVHKHGSGVGLININNRIQILFGKEYGLQIESEPDEGTIVSIRIPAVEYNEENQKMLEKGYSFYKEELEGKNLQEMKHEE